MTLPDLLSVRFATDTTVAVLVEGSILLGATWIAASVLRRHCAAARHGIWTLGFALSLVVPLAGTALPSRSLGVLPYPAAPVPADRAMSSAPEGLEVATPFPGLPAPAVLARSDQASPGVSPPRDSGAERVGSALASGFLVLWALGALALGLRLASHRIRVGRLTARGTPASPTDAPSRVTRREARRMGIRRRVRVLYTRELPVPVTWGIVRPVLLLPQDAASWSDTRLRAVTVHELAHVRRWDALSQQLAELARALYWTNPLIWIARRLAARERERACDAEVLRGGMPSSEYAGVLVEMARRRGAIPVGIRPEIEGGLALVGSSRLEGRVAAILDGARPEGRSSRAAMLGSCLALLGIAAPLAATSLTGERPVPTRETPAVADRVLGVRALGMECDEASLWALTRTLQKDPSSAVRTAAAWALGHHDDPRTVHVLAHAADDDSQDPRVRRAALDALGRRDTRDAAEALVAHLRSSDSRLRRAAVRAMGLMRRQSARIRGPVAITMVRDDDDAVRAAAAEALRRVGCDDSVPWLRQALKDPSTTVVRRAQDTLERLVGG